MIKLHIYISRSNYIFKLHIQITHSTYTFKYSVRIRVCIQVHAHTCMYISACAYMYVYKGMRIHVRMHVTYTRAFKCTYIHAPSSNKLEQHGAGVDDQIHRILNLQKKKENSTLHREVGGWGRVPFSRI